jgi:hypothetical protein
VQVSVTRPSMEATDDDFCDSDEDMLPVLMDSDEEDSEADMLPITPRVSLGEMFEQLAGEKMRPDSFPRQGFGWTEEDVGGHGLCIADQFSSESAGSLRIEPPSSSRAKVKLGGVEWKSLQSMHPNKIFCIVIEYVIGRWPHFAVRRSARHSKKQAWRYELARLAKHPLMHLEMPLNARHRSDAYYAMTAWISRVSGRGIRPVRKDMNDEWVKNGKWASMEDNVKRRFHFLKQLET